MLVAVYNTEQYLPQCLDSLLGQTLNDIQIVCIDDASTDGSAAILDRYATVDSRIEVIHLAENGGQAKARNKGLMVAKGRFIAFLDSDDWMSADCLQRAVNTFEQHPKTGCVLLRPIFYYNTDRQEDFKMEPFEVKNGYEAFVDSLTWKIHGWYVAKAELYQQYPFDDSAHSFSDDNTTRYHYYSSDEVRTCEGIYYYRQTEASVSHRYSIHSTDYLLANQSMKDGLMKMQVPSDLLDLYENHRWLNVVDQYMLYYMYAHTLKPSDRLTALQRIRRAWQSIEAQRLRPSLRCKFGFMPMQRSWTAFRLQEHIYFRLKKIMHRLPYT